MTKWNVDSVALCPCLREALCISCRERHFACLRGIAAERGEAWAAVVARTVSTSLKWPPHDDIEHLARALVNDLSRDAMLLEQLAAELSHAAARAWAASSV